MDVSLEDIIKKKGGKGKGRFNVKKGKQLQLRKLGGPGPSPRRPFRRNNNNNNNNNNKKRSQNPFLNRIRNRAIKRTSLGGRGITNNINKKKGILQGARTTKGGRIRVGRNGLFTVGNTSVKNAQNTVRSSRIALNPRNNLNKNKQRKMAFSQNALLNAAMAQAKKMNNNRNRRFGRGRGRNNNNLVRLSLQQKVNRARLTLMKRNLSAHIMGNRENKNIRSKMQVGRSIQDKINRARITRENRLSLRGASLPAWDMNANTFRSDLYEGASTSRRGSRGRGGGNGRRGGGGGRQSFSELRSRQIPNFSEPNFLDRSTRNNSRMYEAYSGNGRGGAGTSGAFNRQGMGNLAISTLNDRMTEQIRWPTAATQMTRIIENKEPEDEMTRGSLDPEIQRTISYIQSRGGRAAASRIGQDYKATVLTSTMKMSERFKNFQ